MVWQICKGTMFFQQFKDGAKTILIVYVNDIILTRDNTAEMERLKKCLAIEIEVKDLGQLLCFLGWRLQDKEGY